MDDRIERYTDDESGWRYYVDTATGERVLSVTTVLNNFLEEDDTGLNYWKQNNDGQGDAPYWQHLFWYSGHLGTYAHFEALNNYEEGLYGTEERRSIQRIIHGPDSTKAAEWQEDGIPTDEDSILYSVLKKRDWTGCDSRTGRRCTRREEYSLFDVMQEDANWFDDQVSDAFDVLVQDQSNVLAVEKYLFDGNLTAGQTDLVYEDPDNGDVVVVDLKTSSSMRQKHLLQIYAYGMLIESDDSLPDTVDRHEVWRFSPEKRTGSVHSDKPVHDIHEGKYFYVDEYGDYAYDGTYDCRAKFIELADQSDQ